MSNIYELKLSEILMCPNTSLPATYDDSLSYLEQLGKLFTAINEDRDIINKLGINVESFKKLILESIEKQTELIKEMLTKDLIKAIPDNSIPVNKLKDLDFDKYIKNKVIKEVNDIGKVALFGLSDDGYFTVTIPDSWQQITFDTSDNGELMIRY